MFAKLAPPPSAVAVVSPSLPQLQSRLARGHVQGRERGEGRGAVQALRREADAAGAGAASDEAGASGAGAGDAAAAVHGGTQRRAGDETWCRACLWSRLEA